MPDNALESAAKDFPLPLHTGNIKYLRINISPSLSDPSDLNYTTLLKLNKKKEEEIDLNRWTKLKHSHSLDKSLVYC